jgi:hypothetical protein
VFITLLAEQSAAMNTVTSHCNKGLRALGKRNIYFAQRAFAPARVFKVENDVRWEVPECDRVHKSIGGASEPAVRAPDSLQTSVR